MRKPPTQTSRKYNGEMVQPEGMAEMPVCPCDQLRRVEHKIISTLAHVSMLPTQHRDSHERMRSPAREHGQNTHRTHTHTQRTHTHTHADRTHTEHTQLIYT